MPASDKTHADDNATIGRGFVVAACAIGMALGAPTFLIYGFGVFIDPLAAAFDTGRGSISLALSIGLVGYMLVGPFIGALADRFGPRRLILFGVIAETVILAAHSAVQQVWQLYLASFLLVVLGGGTGPVTYARIISAWFDRRRGLALGVALTGIGIGGALAPVVGQALISDFGWRTAYRWLAAIVLVVSLLPIALFVRDRPAVPTQSRNGVEPQKNAETESGVEPQYAAVEPGMTLKASLGTAEFWLIAFGFLLFAAGNTGGLVHMPPILTDAGLDAGRAALYTGLLGIGVVVGRLVAGYLLDIYHAPKVAIAFLLGPFLAYAFFLGDIDPRFAFLPVLLFGIGMGAEFDVIPFLVTRYFGLKNFGAVYGLQIAGFSIGSGLGPAMMGFGYDRFGNYDQSIMIAMALLVVGSLVVSRLGNYRYP